MLHACEACEAGPCLQVARCFSPAASLDGSHKCFGGARARPTLYLITTTSYSDHVSPHTIALARLGNGVESAMAASECTSAAFAARDVLPSQGLGN